MTNTTTQTTTQSVCMFCTSATPRETSIMNKQLPTNGIYAGVGAVTIAVVVFAAAATLMGRKSSKNKR
jgi:hypothetical protein